MPARTASTRRCAARARWHVATRDGQTSQWRVAVHVILKVVHDNAAPIAIVRDRRAMLHAFTVPPLIGWSRSQWEIAECTYALRQSIIVTTDSLTSGSICAPI